jgi:hypothetical protein
MHTSKAISRPLAALLSVVCFSTLLLKPGTSTAQELNTILMNSTFELRGPSATDEGKYSVGTVFFMSKPMKDDPTRGYNVLITAAHVLDDVKGEDASLMLRSKNHDGTYSPYPFPIKIRESGQNLYVKNPDVDVAAMYLALPSVLALSFIPLGFLADDTRLLDLEVHPGDELLSLGFPLATDFNTFPVIRAGTLASYPLTPSKAIKAYYYNFHIFPGNSGGPVYFTFANRVYKGGTHIGMAQGVIGLVSQQLSSTQPGHTGDQLDMAKIVPSSFITETIALLPEKQ